MPELPDVEGFRRVAERAAGSRIRRVDVPDAGVLKGVTADRLRRRLRGRVLGTPRRHGKWLAVPLRAPGRRHRPDEPVVVFHFGMTGELCWCDAGEPRHRFDRVVLGTDRRELRFRDMRKLQGIRLLSGDDELAALFAQLGPDAAAVARDEFAGLLHGSRAAVKSRLMDQSAVAGLGNLTVDETLWRARVHPSARSGALDRATVDGVHREMRTVLRRSTAVGRVPDRSSWLTGRRDEPDGSCPRCGTRLRRTTVAGRTSVWCPNCQRR
ncbi:MAG TPA: DNA-formamidopyrimidine glycosylase family protein [Streptosporangiales bacterium]